MRTKCWVKPSFYQLFDPTLIPILVLSSEELLHWNFHFFFIIKVSRAYEVNYWSEQVIIRGSSIQTICWVWYQCDPLKFFEFIPEIITNTNIANLLTYHCMFQQKKYFIHIVVLSHLFIDLLSWLIKNKQMNKVICFIIIIAMYIN